MKFTCGHCGKEGDKPTGEVNRARKAGLNLYCDETCSGLGRRKHKTKAQKVEEKRLYDAEYRNKNRALLKKKKAVWFKKSYDPEKARVERKKTMPRHIEYCRRPEYKEQKKVYDRKYRAEREYGEYAECFVLAMEIRDEALERMSDYEIRYEKGRLNGTQLRKRALARANSTSPEVGSLVNIAEGQKR